MAIDAANKFLVGALGTDVVVLNMQRRMTPADAMNLAVWLYVLASMEEDAPTRAEFDEAIKAAFAS